MIRSTSVKLSTGLALVLIALSPAYSSSHREAPNIMKMPNVDKTDVYAFRSYEPGRAGFSSKGFGKAYRADPKSEPANLVAGDMVPVSTTAEPT